MPYWRVTLVQAMIPHTHSGVRLSECFLVVHVFLKYCTVHVLYLSVFLVILQLLPCIPMLYCYLLISLPSTFPVLALPITVGFTDLTAFGPRADRQLPSIYYSSGLGPYLAFNHLRSYLLRPSTTVLKGVKQLLLWSSPWIRLSWSLVEVVRLGAVLLCISPARAIAISECWMYIPFPARRAPVMI